jgi:hypothetical protein
MRPTTEDWRASYSTKAQKVDAVSAAAQTLGSEGFTVNTTDASTGMIYAELPIGGGAFGLSTSPRTVPAQVFVLDNSGQGTIKLDFRFPPGSAGGGDPEVFLNEFATRLKTALPGAKWVQ